MLVYVDSHSCALPLQVGFWTVKAQDWSSHHPVTCLLVLGSGCVWVRPWPRWSSSFSCPGSSSASHSLSQQGTHCPVWRASLVWSSSQSSTRWTPCPDQAGRGSARDCEVSNACQHWLSAVRPFLPSCGWIIKQLTGHIITSLCMHLLLFLGSNMKSLPTVLNNIYK